MRKGVELLRKNPALMLPQLIPFVVTAVIDITGGKTLSGGHVLLDLVSIVLLAMVAGSYPLMVQTALKGQPFSPWDAVSKSIKKFGALLPALIVTGLLVVVGLLLVIVPGVFFLCWYVYTIPSIMLENKGVLAGMAASKAFGRDKKTATFSIFIVAVLASIVAVLIEGVFSLASATLGSLVLAVLYIPITTWVYTTLSFVYIRYGLSMTPAEPSFPGQTPPTSVAPPAAIVEAAPGTGKHFCPSCGAPIAENAKFCPSCGRPV